MWEELNAVIGSQKGDKFRRVGQGLTFEVLLEEANTRLADLTPRYALAPVPGGELELMVIDHDMGDDVRSTASLSGGESFLASLALALALPSLGSRRTRIETLFVDEGFGTLDPETLDVAVSALEAQQDTGCHVGVLSHVHGLSERIGVRVRVHRRGAGASRVTVEAGEA